MQPEAFTLNIAETAIVELRERLARTRFPDQAPGEPWEYGTNVEYLRGLVEYLAHGIQLAGPGGTAVISRRWSSRRHWPPRSARTSGRCADKISSNRPLCSGGADCNEPGLAPVPTYSSAPISP